MRSAPPASIRSIAPTSWPSNEASGPNVYSSSCRNGWGVMRTDQDPRGRACPPHPDGVNAGRRLLHVDEAHAAGPDDRLGARARVELAVDRVSVRLDGVRGDLQPDAHL